MQQKLRSPKSRNLANDLNWDDVRLFLGLCRSRSVRDAAELLGVDPSTVSRRLAALEETLAATLFDRGREGIAPTEAAEDLMPVAEELEAVMARFANAAEGLERAAAGLVRITCPSDVAEVVVAPMLGELLERYPGLRVELVPSEAILDLTRREADIALRIVRPERGDLVVTKVAQVRWVLAAAPVLAKRLGTLRSWSDAPWIGWGERLSSSWPARWVTARLPEGGDPVVRSDSFMLQVSLVASGLGVGLVPEPSAQHYGLVPVKLSPALREAASEWPVAELFLVTHRALRQVPRVSVVWDLIVARMAARKFG
jgi:DNA-binding transcriptional LysR family regulator